MNPQLPYFQKAGLSDQGEVRWVASYLVGNEGILLPILSFLALLESCFYGVFGILTYRVRRLCEVVKCLFQSGRCSRLSEGILWHRQGVFASRDVQNALCDSQVALCDSQVALCDSQVALCDSEDASCDSGNALCDSHVALCDSGNALCDSQDALCDSKYALCHSPEAGSFCILAGSDSLATSCHSLSGWELGAVAAVGGLFQTNFPPFTKT